MHCLREGVNKGKFTDKGDKNCNNLISLLCKLLKIVIEAERKIPLASPSTASNPMFFVADSRLKGFVRSSVRPLFRYDRVDKCGNTRFRSYICLRRHRFYSPKSLKTTYNDKFQSPKLTVGGGRGC